jgi:hypothetical protein
LFEKVKKLLAKGLDSKANITNVHVTTANITKIFDNVQKFKTTNPLLSQEHKELERLYWKIYSTGHITNNELYLWLMKGWIADTKGHKVNWAKATAFTT